MLMHLLLSDTKPRQCKFHLIGEESVIKDFFKKMGNYACLGKIGLARAQHSGEANVTGVKGDATDAYFAVFADVFTLYSALTFFICSSRYQDPCLLGICSREAHLLGREGGGGRAEEAG